MLSRCRAAGVSLAVFVGLAGLPSALLSQELIIAEFLAVNSNGIEDAQGDTSDWLEVVSLAPKPVDLDGWFLTDDPAVLQKWRFPARVLEPGDALVVFASGKGLVGEELHTNFQLSSAAGSYLALVAPDGSVVHEYLDYPVQRKDISYGLVQSSDETALLAESAPLRYRVPTSDAEGSDWIAPGFSDASWTSGPGPIGFDAGGGGVIPDDELVNLARKGTATQSSTGFGGEAHRAIDGNRDSSYSSGSITHTATGDASPWWEVDLGDEFGLSRVDLWNRQDCCSERLSNFRVRVFADDRSVVHSSEHFTDRSTIPTRSYSVDFPAGTVGRFVRVEKLGPDSAGNNYLSLAEAEVYGGEAGYGSIVGSDLDAAMRGENATVLARYRFDAEGVESVNRLFLDVRYDDGFAAFLNGTPVASRNAGEVLFWDSSASAEHPDRDAFVAEEINLSAHLDALVEGANVLAIQGLNLSASDDDFLLGITVRSGTVETEGERYLLSPSPGEPNGGETVQGIVSDTRFSIDRGFYDAAFDVEILTDTPGATIRFTTNGSEPTPSRGTIYSRAIRVDSTTVLRAIAYREGWAPTNVDTHTYVFLDDVISSPVMRTSITEDPRYAPEMRAALTDLPTISIATRSAVNGTTETDSSIEWIAPDGSRDTQEDVGVRHFGGAFTNFDKKNFRLYFRGVYGKKKFEFPLFDGHERGIRPVERFDQLELRSGSHDMNQRGFYMSNRFTDDTMLDMGNVNPHGRFVHLYMNGVYWGQYHLRERWNADMLAQYLGGHKDDYEAINGNWNVGGWADPGTPYDGDGSAWTRIKSLRDDYAAVRPYLDVPHYIDFMLMFLYGNSEDEYRCVGPAGPGSGFKWFLNDADGFLRSTGDRTSMGQPGRQNGDGPGSIFSMLLDEGHPDYMTLLADRIHRHFFNDGAMTPDRNRARLVERCDQVERAFYAEAARWNYRTPSSWQSAKNSYIGGVIPSRTAIVVDHFRGAGLYPSLEAPEFSQHGGPIDPPFFLQATAPRGTVMYTPTGADPRRPGGSVEPSAIELPPATMEVLLPETAPVRVLVPTDGTLGLSWTERSFDDVAWTAGTNGVGFERSAGYEELIQTDVEDEMYDVNPSVYIRIPFDVDGDANFGLLTLRMKYDDGFIAYLNGERVADRNPPEEEGWNSEASGSHSDSAAARFEDIRLDGANALLRPGQNVLAIHGANTSPTSSDLLFIARLEGSNAGEGAILIERTMRMRARTRLAGGDWSALTGAAFVVPVPNLRVTELMYHPPSPLGASEFGGDSFEFIEFQNIGAAPIDLSGLRFTAGIDFDFGEGRGPDEDLDPGEVFVLVSHLEAFASRYDVGAMRVEGEYRRNLGNGGDRVELSDLRGEPVLAFEYSDTWYPATDGGGLSLVNVDATSDPATWSSAEAWTPGDVLGSPGVHAGVSGGFRRVGDVNSDGQLDLSDSVALLLHLFVEASALPCEGGLESPANLAVIDANADGNVDITDAIYSLAYLFQGGPAPVLGTSCRRIEGCESECSF